MYTSSAGISTFLFGLLYLTSMVLSTPLQDEADVKKSVMLSSRREESGAASDNINARENSNFDQNKRAPRKPFILWGRDVAAKDSLKNNGKVEELQPGMWGKRALVKPRLDMLWGRTLKEKNPKMGLWGREKAKEVDSGPQAGLWGRASEPGKIGLWGRQLQEEFGFPHSDGNIEGLWGKELGRRLHQPRLQREMVKSKEFERELEKKIISLFRQLRANKLKRVVLEKNLPKDAIGIWG